MMKNNLHNPEKENRILMKSKNRAGVSIVEAMVALVILAVFISGTTRILMAHRQLADKAREHYVAINIAKNRLELVRTFSFAQATDFVETEVPMDARGVPNISGNFRRSTEISQISSNLVELVVTVELRDRKSLSFEGEKEQLTTFFAEYLTEDSSVGGGVAPNSI